MHHKSQLLTQRQLQVIAHTHTHMRACTNKQMQEKGEKKRKTPKANTPLTPNPHTKTKKVE